MKQFFKIVMVCLSILLIVSASCSVAFAAPEVYYSIASDKPTVTEYSGYVELLFEHKTSGQRFVTVLGWFFTPSVNTSSDLYSVSDKPILRLYRDSQFFRLGIQTESGVSGNMSFIMIDTSSQVVFNVLPIPDDNNESFQRVDYGSSYSLIGMHYYGSFDMVTESGSDEEFYVTYGSDTVISYGLNQVLSALYSIIELMPDTNYTSQLDDIISNLNSLDTSLESFYTDFKTVLNQLQGTTVAILRNLETIVQNTDEVEGLLSDVFDILSNMYGSLLNIEYYVPYIYEELSAVNAKLQQIINLLKVEAPSTTKYDNSDLDNYYDAENGLLQNSDVDVGSAVQVEINQNALTVIWDFVERALNSHGKVFGMVLTILSLGIIALILGR